MWKLGGNSENALSAILNDQESHVSAKPMEQRVSREMEHTNSFHPSICPRDLPELETDMWGSGAQELDIGVEIELAVQQFMGFEEQCDDEDRKSNNCSTHTLASIIYEGSIGLHQWQFHSGLHPQEPQNGADDMLCAQERRSVHRT